MDSGSGVELDATSGVEIGSSSTSSGVSNLLIDLEPYLTHITTPMLPNTFIDVKSVGATVTLSAMPNILRGQIKTCAVCVDPMIVKVACTSVSDTICIKRSESSRMFAPPKKNTQMWLFLFFSVL